MRVYVYDCYMCAFGACYFYPFKIDEKKAIEMDSLPVPRPDRKSHYFPNCN